MLVRTDESLYLFEGKPTGVLKAVYSGREGTDDV